VAISGEVRGGPGPPQPGGRRPAPAELALVQAFINTHYDLEFDHGADLIASSAGLSAWIGRSGLLGGREIEPPPAADVARAVTFRECLRELAAGNGQGPRRELGRATRSALNSASEGALLEVRFDLHGRAGFNPASERPIDQAIGSLLAITATAMLDGTWSRLKICPGHDCGWAFYDHSRNQSGRWCSMSVCGGRSKARAHYRRRQAGTE
jgi:predicted RNA-binding Zn ribbon-like protein